MDPQQPGCEWVGGSACELVRRDARVVHPFSRREKVPVDMGG